MGKRYLYRAAAAGTVFFLFMASLVGCSKDETSESESDMYWMSFLAQSSYGENGAFYQDSGFLRFRDAESGLDVLVCDDPDCNHSRENCSAYFDAFIYGTAWDNEKLLLLTDYGADRLGDMFLYETAVNGGERREIAAFENVQSVLQTVFTESRVIFSYYNGYDENLESLSEEQAGIVVYDRNTGESRTIWSMEAWNARILKINVLSDGIVFSALYYDVSKDEVIEHESDSAYLEEHQHIDVYFADVTGEDVLLIREDVTDLLSGGDGGIFYLADDAVYRYDLESGCERETGWDVSSACYIHAEGEQIFSKYDAETSLLNYYVYESESENLHPIGSVHDIIVSMIFDGVVYAYDYNTEDGNGVVVYCSTEDFLKGNFDMFQEFE